MRSYNVRIRCWSSDVCCSDLLFADHTLLDWGGDVLDLIDAKAEGPVILVGSSMGGWLMLLTALALVQRDGAGRVAGLVGIAAAPDFTDWGFSDAEKAIIPAEGALVEEKIGRASWRERGGQYV